MKRTLVRLLASLSALVFAPVEKICAQGFGASHVQIMVWGEARTNEATGESFSAGYSIDLPELANNPWGGARGVSGDTTGAGTFTTDAAYLMVEPGKTYIVVTEGLNLAESNVQVTAPPDYLIELNGVECTSYGSPGTLRIVPRFDIFTGRAGTASSFAPGRVYWQAALGSLKNGDPARSLAILDAGLGENWSDLFTPKGLTLQSGSSEVGWIPTPPGASAPFVAGEMRQVVTNEAYVDIVPAAGRTSYDLEFYSRDTAGASQSAAGQPYSFTGTPYVIFTVARDDSDTSLKITRRDLSRSGSVVRTFETTLRRTGTSVSNFAWTIEDWHEVGQPAPVIEVTATTTTVVDNKTRRVETITRRDQANAVASVTEKQYETFPWGEELMRVQYGTTGPITENLSYHTWLGQSSPDQPWGNLRARRTTGGGWVTYDYGGAPHGRLTRTFRPFVSSPDGPPTAGDPNDWDATKGEVTSLIYASVEFDRIGLMATTVNNVQTSKSTTTFADSDTGGNPLVVAKRSDWADSSGTAPKLSTTIKYFRENSGDEMLRNQIHAVVPPDGTKQAFVYQRGTLTTVNGDKVFVPDPAGGFVRSVVIQGTAQATADRLTTFALTAGDTTYDNEDLFLVDGKSTLDVVVRDESARVCRTESYVRLNFAWARLGWVDYLYDYANRLVERHSSNGAFYRASYQLGEGASGIDSGRLEWEQDDTGVKMVYAYDAAGRVHTVTKEGGPTTTYDYDAAGRVLKETLSGAGQTNIQKSCVYDDAGRLRQETTPGFGTVSFDYDPVNRTQTVTAPDGGTKIIAKTIDGRVASLTGSAVVNEHYRYSVDAGGNRWTRVNLGAAPVQPDASQWDVSSLRQRRSKTDPLGRIAKTERAGFDAQPPYTEDFAYDTTKGRLTSVMRTGYAPTLYDYDELSQVKSIGLGISHPSGPLQADSKDRLVEFDSRVESDGGLWLRRQTTTYAVDDNDRAKIVSSSRRLFIDDFSGSLREKIQTTDADGDVTTTTTLADFANKTVTVARSHPGFANPEKQVFTNGLLVRRIGSDNLAITYEYDTLGRAWKVTDPRSNTTTSVYDAGTARLHSITDAAGAGASTPYASQTFGYQNGRMSSVTDAQNGTIYYDYNRRGQLLRQWGTGTYPVSFAYSSLGERTAMRTFRNPAEPFTVNWPLADDGPNSDDPDPDQWTSGSQTRWQFDPASGLLKTKTDAAGVSATYTYNVRGQVATRTAGGNVTRYRYFGDAEVAGPATGELESITYVDATRPASEPQVNTPPVSYTYTRAGQIASVKHGAAGDGVNDAGTYAFHYNGDQPQQLDYTELGAFNFDRRLTPIYDTTSEVGGIFGGYDVSSVKGRYAGFNLGVSGDAARDLQVKHTYSSFGRFVGVTARGGAASGNVDRNFVYSYGPSEEDPYATGLLTGYDVIGTPLAVSIAYERKRDLVASVDSKWGTTGVTRHDNTYDKVGQRISDKRRGAAFADYFDGVSGYSAVYRYFTYNARGEVETDTMYSGDAVPAFPTVPAAANELYGRRAEYRYDQIGNRKTVGALATTDDDNYVANDLNQYESKENKSVRVVGTAVNGSSVSVTPSVGGVNQRDRNWTASLVPDNGSGPATASVTVSATVTAGASTYLKSATRQYFVPAQTQRMRYDAEGNLTNDGVWKYTYDAERRLIRMDSLLPPGFGIMRYRLDFRYDFLGRRIEKAVKNLDGTAPDYTLRYLYDGWNLIAETDASGNILHSYAWGLDVAGSLSNTAGVGALLEITTWSGGSASQPTRRYFPTRDANGNISALVRDDGVLAAVYEYGAFGEPTRVELKSDPLHDDPTLAANPFRFSSRFTDLETGLVYYGLRYYSPSFGRFISRDLIEETGGINLYGFCGNAGLSGVDLLGMADGAPPAGTNFDGGSKSGSDPGYWTVTIPLGDFGPTGVIRNGPPLPLEDRSVDQRGGSKILQEMLNYVGRPESGSYADDTVPSRRDNPEFRAATDLVGNAIPLTAKNLGAVWVDGLGKLIVGMSVIGSDQMESPEVQRGRVIGAGYGMARTEVGGRLGIDVNNPRFQIASDIAAIAISVFFVPQGGELRLGEQRMTVFRVEGAPNARIIIDSAGRILINDGERMLWINIGQRTRALKYLQQKIAGGLKGAQIKSFEVPQSFLEAMRATAVEQAEAKQFPGSPQVGDPTKAPDQYGLGPQQIEMLRRAIIQGSGKPKG